MFIPFLPIFNIKNLPKSYFSGYVYPVTSLPLMVSTDDFVFVDVNSSKMIDACIGCFGYEPDYTKICTRMYTSTHTYCRELFIHPEYPRYPDYCYMSKLTNNNSYYNDFEFYTKFPVRTKPSSFWKTIGDEFVEVVDVVEDVTTGFWHIITSLLKGVAKFVKGFPETIFTMLLVPLFDYIYRGLWLVLVKLDNLFILTEIIVLVLILALHTRNVMVSVYVTLVIYVIIGVNRSEPSGYLRYLIRTNNVTVQWS